MAASDSLWGCRLRFPESDGTRGTDRTYGFHGPADATREKKFVAALELSGCVWVYNNGSHDTKTPAEGGFRVRRPTRGQAEADSLAKHGRTGYLWGDSVVA
jgi:hypothetical protein